MSTKNLTSQSVTTSKILGYVRSIDGAMLQGAKVICHELETKTLADGFFVLNGLPPGKHEVRVSLQGYKSKGRTVSVQEGKEVTLNFQLHKAVGNAKICGHVYDAESKKPVVQNGTVMLILPLANKYRNIDKDGYYEFENLPFGTYKISTSMVGYEDCEADIAVAEGEIKTHDFLCKAKKTEEPPWG